ncbi:MAG: DNA mismatch repair protein [Bacillota bacterium]|nr:DNA mismatch repair protein [Bacillota bacterium]
MLTPQDKYKKRLAKYTKLLKKQTKSSNIISVLRLITFLLGLTLAILFFISKLYYLCIATVLAASILFIFLIYIHNKIILKKKCTSALIEINEKALKRLMGEWKSFEDCGDDFVNYDHRYSYDLDIFGIGSLFQWICEAKTYLGRLKLKNCLEDNCFSKQDIYERQQAVNELSSKLYWRQQFMYESIVTSEIMENPDEFINWSKDKTIYKTNFIFKIILIILPIITISLAIISLSSVLPFYIPTLFLLLQLAILKVKSENRSTLFMMAEKYSKNIKAYEKMLKIIEKHNFKSPCLKNFHKKLFDKDGTAASISIKKLSNIVETLSSRHNMAYAALNILFMIDYHLLTLLENWKLKYGSNLSTWLDTIGEFETLSSLSMIKYDNPDWTMPMIQDDILYFSSIKMGHPLLGDKRICNDLNINNTKTVLLITGSNMSGKSTLLRTVGINLVLAYAGAPVCAQRLCCSIMQLYSCMRTNDNLEKSISSFYAEILKIKNIVNASNKGEKVFFLLDEIFKGTNSLDRHTGATILIKQLSSKGNLGLVSTHDFELSDLENEQNSRVINYHFEEYYKDDKIYFDYKLKNGVSCTRNAVYLMKLAGIGGIQIGDG